MLNENGDEAFISYSWFFKRCFIYLFFREGRGERGKETSVCGASCMPPTGDLCPDWELNQQPFDWQAGTQPLSYTSQGLFLIF